MCKKNLDPKLRCVWAFARPPRPLAMTKISSSLTRSSPPSSPTSSKFQTTGMCLCSCPDGKRSPRRKRCCCRPSAPWESTSIPKTSRCTCCTRRSPSQSSRPSSSPQPRACAVLFLLQTLRRRQSQSLTLSTLSMQARSRSSATTPSGTCPHSSRRGSAHRTLINALAVQAATGRASTSASLARRTRSCCTRTRPWR